MYVYEIGNNTENGRLVNSGGIEKDIQIKEDLMKIVINGNNESNIEKFNLETKEDLYIATKIAIDCYINAYPADDINNYYKVKEEVDEQLKTRVEKIIKGAAMLLNTEIPEIVKQTETVSINKFEEYGIDNINKSYYSQKYEVKVTGGELTKYEIETNSEEYKNYFTTNILDEANKTEFSGDENIFKIMIPYQDRELPFEIEICGNIQYNINCIFRAVGENSEYIIYAKTGKVKEVISDALSNKKSSLSINFINSNTLEKIYGAVVEANGKTYKVDSVNKLILERIGKGEVILKIISLPEGYIDIGNEYKINVPYAENYIEDIKLTPKKEEIDDQNNIKDKEDSDKIEQNNDNDKIQNEDKEIKEDIEVKENVNSNIDNLKEERKRLPRTRKRLFLY